MKWTRSELSGSSSEEIRFDEAVEIDPEVFASNSRINGVKDVRVSGTGLYQEASERFYVNMEIHGIMCLPDAVTGLEIECPFETEREQVFAFEDTDEDDVWVVKGEVIELLPVVIEEILSEVPLQVTEASPEDYPSGDGWRVISEEEFEKSQAEKGDPRLAKLRDYGKE